jgi:four helix bundle protein
VRDYRKLKVWEKAHQLTLEVYKASQKMPSYELYGLTAQMRRAAVSIPANIAEGYGRSGDPEFSRFLRIAQGSSSELSYHLLVCSDLGYLDHRLVDRLADLVDEIQRMLAALVRKLK